MIATANAVILAGWTTPASLYVQRICHALRSCAIIAPSHSDGPVHQKHQSEAVATPTDKRGFATSESQAGAGVSGDCHHGFGRGGAGLSVRTPFIREDARMASDMFLTPRPPDALKNADGGFVHVPEGIDMTRTTSTKGQSARTTAPKTTREPVAGLNWFIEVKGPRGAHIAYALDFPDEPYFESLARGYRAASELLTAIEARTVAPWVPRQVLRLAHEPRESTGRNGSNGARSALCEVAFEALAFTARTGQYTSWLDSEVARAERCASDDRAFEQQRIQRSIEARRAKQAARKAAKVEGDEDART